MAKKPLGPQPHSSVWRLQNEAALTLALFVALGVMLLPLPGLVLDLLLTCNLGLSLLLLLATLSARRALDLSVFPSVVLLLTLLRLSLNVATTRSILLNESAGGLVSAFGHVVVSGNVVVGTVVFLILVVIQFVVITKGAGRISEVSARFTLDALPGKQLAIDAELNAGAIDEAEARRRRKQLAAETEFYGSMDGASKFVRGDAIAGLIITSINLIGGAILGVSHGLSLVDATRTYSILTIGDGLASQLPALMIATTAGILTTKADSDDALASEIQDQLFNNDRPLWIGAALLAVLGLLPEVPTLPTLVAAGGIVAFAFRRTGGSGETISVTVEEQTDEQPETWDEGRQLRDFLLTDRAIVEIGPGLVGLMNERQPKSLAQRITNLRREFSQSRGLWIPAIRVRVNVDLQASAYRILIAGREAARGKLSLDSHLAILPEGGSVNLPGEPTEEPVFKLPARWIVPAIARQAEAQGCTVVDPASVLLTHLGEVLQEHGHELLTRETLKELLNAVQEFAPTVVEEVKSETLRLGLIQQVLVQLAEERVSLADLALVLEAILNHAPQHKTPDDLVDAVRQQLGHLVCSRFLEESGDLRVLALHPHLESQLRESALADGQIGLAPDALERLVERVSDEWRKARTTGTPLAVLTHHSLRRPMRRLLGRATPGVGFIAYREIPGEVRVAPVDMVRADEVFTDSGVTAVDTPAAPVNRDPTSPSVARAA